MPDRAEIGIAIEGDGGSREAAYRAASDLAIGVDTVLTDMAESVERVVTTVLTVQPRTRWRKGEASRAGWRATRSSRVSIKDLGRVGELIALVVEAGGSVAGPDWLVDRDNAAHDEVRGLAAADAHRRARSYASALGLRLGPAAWVAEPGLRSPGRDLDWAGGAVAMSASPVSGGLVEQAIEVDPERIAIPATVEVGFSIAPSEADPS